MLGHGTSARREQQRRSGAMDRPQPPLPNPWQCGVMSSLGRKGEAGVFCFISDLEKLENRVTDGQSVKNILPEPRQHRHCAAGGAGPPRAPSRAAGGTSLRRPRGGAAGGRLKVGAALRWRARSPRLPADGVRLAGLRLRGAGGGGRCRGLRQGRQRPVSSCRSSVRRLSGTRRVPAVQRSKECVAFPRGIWHLVYCYGNEILQFQKGNARDNCWCQFTDGWTAWIADDGKTY